MNEIGYSQLGPTGLFGIYHNNNNNTLFKYIIHKHNTRYVFEKEDREVIPIEGPLTELLKKTFKKSQKTADKKSLVLIQSG